MQLELPAIQIGKHLYIDLPEAGGTIMVPVMILLSVLLPQLLCLSFSPCRQPLPRRSSIIIAVL